jgi:hypothetical protein
LPFIPAVLRPGRRLVRRIQLLDRELAVRLDSDYEQRFSRILKVGAVEGVGFAPRRLGGGERVAGPPLGRHVAAYAIDQLAFGLADPRDPEPSPVPGPVAVLEVERAVASGREPGQLGRGPLGVVGVLDLGRVAAPRARRPTSRAAAATPD